MAYKNFDDLDLNTDNSSQNLTTFKAGDASSIKVPHDSFIGDADLTRDGMDLVLDGPQGTIVIEGYFAAEPQPNIVAPNGKNLTPDLVDSFAKSPMEYADAGSLTDESPVGGVSEVSGDATVTRVNGTVEKIAIGTPIYQGDVIETTGDGAVNIVFIDETSFAVSEDARLAIDEYVFDPSTQSGTTNFSVLKGVFVFTSGLIGRDDPDDVEIDTPIGSIGIRGTIIAGNVDTGEITVIEGAIVLRSLKGFEMTLASQFETARFDLDEDGGIENLGQLDAADVVSNFSSISTVSPDLFSSIEDAASENTNDGDGNNDGDATDGDGDDSQLLDDPGNEDSGLPDNNGGNNDGGGDNQDASGQNNDDNDNNDNNDGGDDDSGSLGDPPPNPNTFNEDPTIRNFSEFSGPSGLFQNMLNVANGTAWDFNFARVFTDPDGPDSALTYQLDINPDLAALLAASDIVIDFNSNTGQLNIDFADLFSSGLITPEDSEIFDISVFAIDQDGGVSDTFTLNLNIFNTGTLESGSATLDQFSTIGSGVFTTGNDESFIFFSENDGQQLLTITGQDDVFVRTDDEGENIITIDSNSFNTTIVGGDAVDKIIVNEAKGLDLFAGGGNDIITFGNNVVVNHLETAQTDAEAANIYGGGQNVQVGSTQFASGLDLLNSILSDPASASGSGTGFNDNSGNNIEFGDTLEIAPSISQAPNTIDFAEISSSNNQISGIEVIDASNGINNEIVLNLQSVIDLTGPSNFLVINLDAGDTLTLLDFDETNIAQDNLQIDMDGNGTPEVYDLYYVDGVTLLIQDTGSEVGGTQAV